MGLLKKLGIVVLLYVIIGVAWSVMRHIGYLPPPGGLEGPLNLIYLIFEPISLIYFMIVMAIGLYP